LFTGAKALSRLLLAINPSNEKAKRLAGERREDTNGQKVEDKFAFRSR
jgi:hypothetical protein